MLKRSLSYEVMKPKSDNINSMRSQTPSSPLMQLTQNENFSNGTHQGTTHLRRKCLKRSRHFPMAKKMKEMQMAQMLTNSKLDFITKILLAQFPSFSALGKTSYRQSSFCFSFSKMKKKNHKRYEEQPRPIENENEIFDYFSFNIKPESSFVSEGEFKDKFIQPDKLIAFKFLEDTEVFNGNNVNKNNISTSNFNRLTSNPFTQSSNKSDGELKQIGSNCGNRHDSVRLPIKTGSHIEPIESSDLNKNFQLLKEDISLSLVNYEEDKKDNIKEETIEVNEEMKEETAEVKESIDIEPCDALTVSQNTSQSNISSSIQSGSNVVKSSQDRFRKVRGFNFKNNIKTKKFSQGLMGNNEDKQSRGIKYIDYKQIVKKREEGSGSNDAKAFPNKALNNEDKASKLIN